MHQSFGVSPFASPSFFHFTFVNVSNFYFVCSTLQSLLYKNICSISIFFSNKLFSILILRIRRSKLAKVGNRLQLWTLICMDYHIDPASAPVVPWRSFPTYRVSECCRCTAFQLSISVLRSELIPAGEIDFF